MRSYKMRKGIIAQWHEYFRGMALKDITRTAIQGVIDTKSAVWSNATTNTYLTVLSSVLHRAVEVWEWIDRVPPIPRVKDRKRRVRWLTPEEAQRLLQHLPESLAEMMRFALSTGLRQSNVMKLEWSQVDMARPGMLDLRRSGQGRKGYSRYAQRNSVGGAGATKGQAFPVRVCGNDASADKVFLS